MFGLNTQRKNGRERTFKTIVFPVARAGAIFHVNIMTFERGKLECITLRYEFKVLRGTFPGDDTG